MSIALLGGTFNPVHLGHLRIAVELAEYLDCDELRLVPCSIPPHRDEPEVSAQHRLAMLHAATVGIPRLTIDDRELRRDGPSYSIDTVREIRSGSGADSPLYLCIGMDALALLDTWKNWRSLTDYCHVVAMTRPDSAPPVEGPVGDWIRRHSSSRAAIKLQPCGLLHICELSLFPISATTIRSKLRAGESIDFLTPASVVNHIREHQLYI